MSREWLLCVVALLPANDNWFVEQAGVADELLRSGKPAEALARYEKMQSEAEKQRNQDWELYARWKQAECQNRQGNPSKGQETLEKAIREAPRDHGLLWLLHRDLGLSYLQSWKLERANPHIDKALASARAHKEAKGYRFAGRTFPVTEQELIRLRLMRARGLASNGENTPAEAELRAIEEAIPKQKGAAGPQPPPGWEPEYVECQQQLADADRRNRNTPGAIGRLENALKTLRDAEKGGSKDRGVIEFQFGSHVLLAMNYMKLTWFDEARNELAEVRELFRRHPALATRLTRGDLENAEAALRIEEGRFAYQNDSPDAQALGQLAAAEKSARQAIAHYQEAGGGAVSYSTALAWDNLAQVHELRARISKRQGKRAESLGEYGRSETCCDEAIQRFGEVFRPSHDRLLEQRRFRARLHLNLENADLRADRKDVEEALKLFVNRYGERHVDCGPYHHTLLEIEDRLGNAGAAKDHADAHRKLASEALTGYLRGMTPTEQVQFFRVWDDPGLYASLRLGIRHPDLCGEASAEWLLNGKAKIAEILADVNRRARGGTEYRTFQKAIQRQAYLLYGLPGDDPRSKDPAALGKELLREEKTKRAAAEWGKAPAIPWHDLKALREKLLPTEVYLDVFCLPSEEGGGRAYYAWVVTKAGPVRVVELGGAREIERLVKVFQDHQEHFMDEDGPFSKGIQVAEKILRDDCLRPLSDLVLRPLQKAAAGKTCWIVSPDGALWSVPWGALLWPGDGRYAVEQVTFRYAISGRDVLRRADPPAPLAAPWILGDPNLNRPPAAGEWRRRAGDDALGLKPLRRLPASRAECRQVADCLKPFFTGVPRVVEDTTTKEAFLKLDKPPRFVYLSTHGFYSLPTRARVDDPLLRCGVVFAGFNYIPGVQGPPELPGLMTGAEVLGANLRGTELVVLSACQTGVGERSYGQSPADLRHAFHLAGARRVVSSLWEVEEESTRDLMIALMKSLGDPNQTDRAAALTRAQVQLLEALRTSNRRHSHPYFWAAFTLSGF